MRGTRAAIQAVDGLLGFVTLVGIIVLAPVWTKFTSMISGSVDPFSQLLIQLIVPLLLIALVISMGVSARGGR